MGGNQMDRIKKELALRNHLRNEINQIRNTGEVNMFDVPNVKRMAYYYNCHELVRFLEERRADYINFILTGNFE